MPSIPLYLTTKGADPLVYAFTWTLVHSLWQGFLLAFLAASGLKVLERRPPETRYRFLLFTLIAFVVVSAGTLIYLWLDFPVEQLEMTGNLRRLSKVQGISQINAASPVLSRFPGMVSGHSVMITLCWLCFFLLKVLLIIKGFVYNRRLERTAFRIGDPAWISRFQQICSQMDMKRMVRLMESAYVSMPVVIGYLKPVILIPAGLWTAIPADQLEAALLHELAHIRRKDFLVYLFQKVIEAVWFFNPFVYWISAVLRQEREYCCDDMALAHIRDRKILVQALISFKEATLRKKMHALAFSGKDSPLLKRVARIAGQSGSYSGRGFWTRAVVIAMICLIPLLTLVDKAGRSFAGLFTPISVSMKARPGIPVIKKRAGHAPAGQPIGPGNTFALHRHHFPDKIPASQVLRKINSSRTLRLAKPPAKFPLPADDIPLSSPEESYGRSEQAESPALDSSMNLPPAIYRPAKGGIRKIAHVRGPYYTAVTIDNRIPSELKESFTGRKDGLRYMVLRINKRITGFYIDDQPVPEENLSKYQGVIKDMLGELIHDSIYFAAISS